MKSDNILQIYCAASILRSDYRPKAGSWGGISGGAIESFLRRELPSVIDKLRGHVLERDVQVLTPLFWLMPKNSESLAHDVAPIFIEFVTGRSKNQPDLADICAAAVAFGCGWRPNGVETGEVWPDAQFHLSLMMFSHVWNIVKELHQWGIWFDDWFTHSNWTSASPDSGDGQLCIYQWAAVCANALTMGYPAFCKARHADASDSRQGDTIFGRFEGSLSKFQEKDCACAQYFHSQLKHCLLGGCQTLQADSFTRGLLWHAMRKVVSNEPPPKLRMDGWLCLTERMAILNLAKPVNFADSARPRRTLTLGRQDENGNVQMTLEPLDLGDFITKEKRIFVPKHHAECPFSHFNDETYLPAEYEINTTQIWTLGSMSKGGEMVLWHRNGSPSGDVFVVFQNAPFGTYQVCIDNGVSKASSSARTEVQIKIGKPFVKARITLKHPDAAHVNPIGARVIVEQKSNIGKMTVMDTKLDPAIKHCSIRAERELIRPEGATARASNLWVRLVDRARTHLADESSESSAEAQYQAENDDGFDDASSSPWNQ